MASREAEEGAVMVEMLRELLGAIAEPKRRIAVLMQALAEEIAQESITPHAKHQMIALATHAMTCVVDHVEYEKVKPS